MIEFAAFISETWSIPEDVAETICSHFAQGDSLYFITDYVPNVATQTDFDTVSEIYEFLNRQKALAPHREKVRTILRKANVYDEDMDYKVEMSISAAELDDLAMSHRTNVRTRGALAIAKGLLPCADEIDDQKSEGDLDALFAEYASKIVPVSVSTESSDVVVDENSEQSESSESVAEFTPVDLVKSGVIDILSERYGFDEHARIVVREFVEDEGYIELSFKKKTKKYDLFRDKQTLIRDLTDEDVLLLRDGELKKDIKVKIGAPLFQIDDLLGEYFLENHDAIGASVILDSIHEAWTRHLQPMVEEVLKEEIIRRAENRLAREIRTDLGKLVNEYISAGKQSLMMVAAYSETEIELVTVDSNGLLLRATRENVRDFGRPFISAKLKQMVEQYHPSRIAVLGNKLGTSVTDIVKLTVDSLISTPEVFAVSSTTKIAALLKSDFFKESAAQLEENTLKTYAYGVATIIPVNLLIEIGSENFTVHPKQSLLGEAKMAEVTTELFTAASLRRGVELNKKQDELLLRAGITQEKLEILRTKRKEATLNCKYDIRDLEELTESDYHNAAGYIIFSNSDFVLDKSTIHPAEFSLVESICNELGSTPEDLCRDLALLEKFVAADEFVARFVSEKISEQLRAAKRFVSLSSRPKRKLRMDEVKVDAILDGRVTNIAAFGVFVDINAMSDGLVHISELTDEYVESAEQVVQVGDSVKVKVIEVDGKKRRISLSMKRAGNSGLRIRASRTQIDDLASFFNRR